MKFDDGSFLASIQSLGAGIKVEHIASFDLKCCNVEDPVSVVFDAPEFTGFDHIPVRGPDGRIVGILDRSAAEKTGSVFRHMCPLDTAMVVSAQTPLLTLIKVLGEDSFRLVLGEEGGVGIVTKGDLLKLPVRMMAFAHITQLETLMSAIIGHRFSSDGQSWFELLGESRRNYTLDKQAELAKSGSDPDVIELLDFCDKRDILRKRFRLGSVFDREMKDIEKLRNSIAHSATYITSENDVRTFIGRLERIRFWIDELPKRCSFNPEQADCA